MIRSFRHRGLKMLCRRDRASGVNPKHADKLKRILARLEIAVQPKDLDLPGWRLHPLKGELNGYWSVTVNGNWRVVFRFEEDEVTDVDYLDYH